MKITLLVVGKTTDSNINKLIDNYLGRLKFYTDFSIQVIPELKNCKNLRQDEKKEKETYRKRFFTNFLYICIIKF